MYCISLSGNFGDQRMILHLPTLLFWFTSFHETCIRWLSARRFVVPPLLPHLDHIYLGQSQRALGVLGRDREIRQKKAASDEKWMTDEVWFHSSFSFPPHFAIHNSVERKSRCHVPFLPQSLSSFFGSAGLVTAQLALFQWAVIKSQEKTEMNKKKRKRKKLLRGSCKCLNGVFKSSSFMFGMRSPRTLHRHIMASSVQITGLALANRQQLDVIRYVCTHWQI